MRKKGLILIRVGELVCLGGNAGVVLTPHAGPQTPINTVAPAIDNPNPGPGDVITTSDGTWRGADSFAYAWFSDGSQIASGINAYTIQDSDVGHSITSRVTATNDIGSTTAECAAVVPAAPAPVNTVAPALGFDDFTGTFTCDTGTWNWSPTSFAYQWFENGAPVSTDSTWVRGSTPNPGTTAKCTVTATNAVGSTPADSNQITF